MRGRCRRMEILRSDFNTKTKITPTYVKIRRGLFLYCGRTVEDACPYKSGIRVLELLYRSELVFVELAVFAVFGDKLVVSTLLYYAAVAYYDDLVGILYG